MKRPYLLIAGEQYYPSAGTRDWRGCFETQEEAEGQVSIDDNGYPVIEGRRHDWYHIVDLDEWTK